MYQAAKTSDIRIENKTRIFQGANTPDISIYNKIRICQADVSIKHLTHLISE
jgi:hypothetical protein